jgi:uroporphyrinogen decarboxylase
MGGPGMTGKEVLHRTIDFDQPPRIATSSQWRAADTVFVGYGRPTGCEPAAPGQDEWGCVRTNQAPDKHGSICTGHPLLHWAASDDYVFPDPNAPGRLATLETRLAEGDPALSEKFVIANIGTGFVQKLADLLGFENFLLTLAMHPERIDALLTKTLRFLKAITARFAQYAEVDAIVLFDDQAMNTGPYFSMGWWRRLFRPRYRDLFDAIHAAGKKVMLHCCGNLTEHLPEFHACGVDILDNKQPLLWLDAAEAFRGRMTFHTCLDFVALRAALRESIGSRIAELITRMSVPEGGFVGTIYNLKDPSMPAENLEAMWDAYRDFSWQAAACAGKGDQGMG